jgi:uncharacterized protein (TIGR00369 family)
MSTEIPHGWLSYSPFHKMINMELERLEHGECVIRMAPRPEMSNAKGDLHGGMIASLLDISMSQAARSTQPDPLQIKVSTITLTVNYLSPSTGVVTVTAKVVRAGASICYVEAEAINAKGEIVAHATGTFRIIRPHKTPAAA